jgi:hypothetical protein
MGIGLASSILAQLKMTYNFFVGLRKGKALEYYIEIAFYGK